MATSVYERQDDQRRRRVLNILAVVLFVLDPLMVLVFATVLSDVSVMKELVAPTSDLLARGIVPVDLAFPAFLGQNICPIGMTLFGSISATKHSSRVGAFFAGMGVLILLIRLSYLWLA